MSFHEVGLFFLLTVAILIISCHSNVQQNIYGTFGILTNFMDRTSKINNVTSWTVTAPLDNIIMLTVVYPRIKSSWNCKSIGIYDNNTKSNISYHTAQSTEFCRFYSNNRVLTVSIMKKLPFLALFEALRKSVDVKQIPIPMNQNFTTNSFHYIKSPSVCLYKGGYSNKITVENRTMNYFFRAFMMDSSMNFTWISTSNNVFTSWNATPPTAGSGCVKMNKMGVWEDGGQDGCDKNISGHICQIGNDSTFYSSCRKTLNVTKNGRISCSSNNCSNLRLGVYGGGWITDNNSGQWIKVASPQAYFITAVATQGVNNIGWVISFEVKFEGLLGNMKALKNSRSQNIRFVANSDFDNVAYNRIEPIIVTKTIALHIKEWHKKIALRMELYGCKVDANTCKKGTIGLENNVIPDSSITSSGQTADSSGTRARLNLDLRSKSKKSCWSASSSSNSWIQINLTTKYYITAVLMQGCGDDNIQEWVTTFKISYGNSTQNLIAYKDSNGLEEFQGNTNRSLISKTSLNPIIVASIIRIYPVDKHNNASLRLELQGCNYSVMAGDANWSSWSRCNATCNGTKYRNRTCDPLQGAYCYGETVQYQSCDLENFCKNFTAWSMWSACTSSCGQGEQMRSRNFTGSYDSTSCTGRLSMLRKCNGTCEPIYGNWSDWGECNMTCGIGFQERTRTCHNWNNTSRCDTTHSMQKCNVSYGNITTNSEWSSWSSCNATCGVSFQKRTRNVTVSNSSEKTQEISSRECTPCLPCMCAWTKWTECSCSVQQNQTRTRNCSGTEPDNLICSGASQETRQCNLSHCQVDGNFTQWSNWTTCSLSCGNGTRYRNRSCTQPPPAHGGKNCTGHTNETQSCKPQPCPVDGNFTQWSNWATCSLTCGNGTRYRNRSCTQPPPAHGGKNCTGRTNETQYCKPQHCSVNGNFSSWNRWSTCTLTCGNGTQRRTRTCNSPKPAYGGRNCTGDYRQMQRCNTQPCPKIPVDGRFSQWGIWSNCTLKCGKGSQHRVRTCTEPPPTNNGENCTGDFKEQKRCNTHFCPINGKWTCWSGWSYCNRPCGKGYKNRTRTCSSPPPQYGGQSCTGNSSESKICDTGKQCPAAQVLVEAKFTDEKYNDSLKDLNNTQSKALKDKITKNVKQLYEDQSIVQGIEIVSFRSGSVVSKFNILFFKMDSTQLIVLQESLEVKLMLSNMPLKALSINATNVPNVRPRILLIKNLSSTSVYVKWSLLDTPSYINSSLKGYSLFYKEASKVHYSPNQMMALESPSNPNATITLLKKFTDYSIRALAFTAQGNGISSDPINFKTDEDVPSKIPTDFTVLAINSTALMVKWKPIPKQYVHGILRGYNVFALNLRTDVNKRYDIEDFKQNAVLTGLSKYEEYSVTICAFTSKGCGPMAQKIMSTLEDVPSLPPQEIIANDLQSTNEITIKWEPVPRDGINGILLEYVITYKLHSQAQSRAFEAKTFTEHVKPSVRKLKIGGLKPYSKYEFQIAARNSKGTGPYAMAYGETCRCPKEIYTNYWFITPYFNNTYSGQRKGIFSHIVQNMIKWSCGDCKNGHGKTVVNFEKDGNGSKALKKSILDVAGNVEDGAQVSFPINGNKDMNKVYGDQVFIPVVESPGIVYLVAPALKSTTALKILRSIISTVPFVLFSIGLAYIAGVIIWFLDAGSVNSMFPRRFTKGVFEGLWWSFISMTTVGYGDRSPVSFFSRWFAMLWTLYGMTLISILTSTMSSSLTTVTLKTQSTIYGAQIAAIENSSEHRIGILKNGKVNEAHQYHSVSDIYDALVNQEVSGALIDTYVVAAKAQMFTEAGIRVAKMLERPFGYGVALSAEIAVLETEFLQYLKSNSKEITGLIKISTETLSVPTIAESNTKDTRLFDASSVLYKNTLIFTSCLLGLAVLCGLVWQYMCYKKMTQVTPRTVDMMAQKQINMQKMKAVVDKFYENTTQRVQELRVRHIQEKVKVLRRMKERDQQQKIAEKARMKSARATAKVEESKEEYNLSELVKLATNMIRS